MKGNFYLSYTESTDYKLLKFEKLHKTNGALYHLVANVYIFSITIIIIYIFTVFAWMRHTTVAKGLGVPCGSRLSSQKAQ